MLFEIKNIEWLAISDLARIGFGGCIKRQQRQYVRAYSYDVFGVYWPNDFMSGRICHFAARIVMTGTDL